MKNHQQTGLMTVESKLEDHERLMITFQMRELFGRGAEDSGDPEMVDLKFCTEFFITFLRGFNPERTLQVVLPKAKQVLNDLEGLDATESQKESIKEYFQNLITAIEGCTAFIAGSEVEPLVNSLQSLSDDIIAVNRNPFYRRGLSKSLLFFIDQIVRGNISTLEGLKEAVGTDNDLVSAHEEAIESIAQEVPEEFQEEATLTLKGKVAGIKAVLKHLFDGADLVYVVPSENV